MSARARFLLQETAAGIGFVCGLAVVVLGFGALS